MKKKNLLLLLTVLFVSINTFAQGGEQPPGVPVDQYIIYAAIFAIGLAVFIFARNEKMQKNRNINL